MFDEFYPDCQFRQGPTMPIGGKTGCGGQAPTSMGAPMGMVPQAPMMQAPYNIFPPAQPQGTAGIQSPMGTPQMPMGTGQPFTGMGQPFMGTGQPFMGPGMPMTGMGQAPTSTFPGPSQVPSSTFVEAPGSPIYLDTRYMQGYLRTLVGRYVKVDFLVGTNNLTDREGILLEVGVSYILLREAQTDDNVMCDLYSIRFVRVYL